MISRILQQDAAICQVLSEGRKTIHLIPSWQDTMVLEAVSAALTPLEDFTDMLSAEKYVSISAVKPLLKHLQDMLTTEQVDDAELTRDIKHCVLDYLEKEYESQALDELLDMCCLLDPRFRLDYVNEADVVDVKSRLETEALQVAEKRSSAAVAATQQQSQQTAAEAPVAPPKKKRLLADIFKKPSGSQLTPEEAVKQEISHYLQ